MPKDLRTIKLHGGRADGRRMQVPTDSTQLTVPVITAFGRFSAVYRPTSTTSDDGVEIWEPYYSGRWTDTTPMAL
jgi:hypothetical protein